MASLILAKTRSSNVNKLPWDSAHIWGNLSSVG